MVCVRGSGVCAGFSAGRRLCGRRVTAGTTETLEGRTLLSGVVVGVTAGSSAAGLSLGTLTDVDGGAVMVREYGTALSIGRPAGAATAPAAPALPAAGAFDIILNKGPNLLNNPVASAAFEEAAAFFESVFHDPITVVIDAEIAPLGGSQLGLANSVIFGDTFATIREAIVADANPADEAILSQLPDEAGFFSTMPDDSYSLAGMAATRANLLALGVDPAELPGPFSEYADVPDSVRRDANITFSSNYPFDYDRSDGIGAGLSDFVGVAIHEIGHSLGFVSAVDSVDGSMGTGDAHSVPALPLDLFRFEPGAGGADFAGGTRVLSPTVSGHVFYDGGLFDPSGITSIAGLARGDIPFSTGTLNGDGNQASHWKDESLIGLTKTIGAMDPIATQGTEIKWTAADQRAFALIGWDAALAAPPAGVSGTVYEDIDANGAYDPDAGEFGIGGAIVYHDANDNGQFDSGVADRFAPAVGLPKPIRDLATIESRVVVEDLPGLVRDVNVTVHIEHPYTMDLVATLISPSGRQVTLFNNVGEEDFFGSSHDFSGTVLDDEAGERIQDGTAPFAGSYTPQQALSIMDGETMNGTWTLRIRDQFTQDEGMLIDWGLTFDTGTGEPHTTSDGDGAYAFTDLAPGAYRLRQVLFDGYRQTQPASNGAHVLTLAEGQQVTGLDFGATTSALASSVVGRHVFYNNSAFDGRDSAADSRDDGAIATDKRALEPGTAATFDNYTSYSRGINGVMIDVMNLPAGGGLWEADFTFRVGNDGDVDSWQELTVAPEVSVRPGAGVDGSDRVTLTWPDGTIVRQWLQVSVNATSNTGLADADLFYFGNLPGEVGDATGAARVTASDTLRVRRDLGAVAEINGPFDFNRDRRINVLDYAIARGNAGRSLHVLSFVGEGAAGAASGTGVFVEFPITPRRASYRPARLLDGWAASLLV